MNDIETGSKNFEAFLTSVLDIAQCAFLIAVVIGIIVFLYPVPGAAGFGFLLLSTIFSLAVLRPKVQKSARAFRAVRKEKKKLEDSINATKEISLLGREKYFHNYYSEISRKESSLLRFQNLLNLSVETFIGSLRFVSLLVAFFAALWSGMLSTSLINFLFVYTILAFGTSGRLTQMFNAVNTMRTANAELSDCYSTMEKYNTYVIVDEEKTPFSSGIELRNISYRYSNAGTDTLHNINMTISKGEYIGIAGENGSGKTTLLDLIAGVYKPRTGEVLVDEEVLSENKKRSWKRMVGYVVQRPRLIRDTIVNNITLGLEKNKVDQQRLQYILEVVKLDQLVKQCAEEEKPGAGRFGNAVSGGQGQRIGIARSLYRNCPILILDEATKSVDPRAEAEIIGSILSMEDQKTIITVTHRLDMLTHCDRVYFIEGGTIAATGKYDELVAGSEKFRKFANMQTSPSRRAGAAPEKAAEDVGSAVLEA